MVHQYHWYHYLVDWMVSVPLRFPLILPIANQHKFATIITHGISRWSCESAELHNIATIPLITITIIIFIINTIISCSSMYITSDTIACRLKLDKKWPPKLMWLLLLIHHMIHYIDCIIQHHYHGVGWLVERPPRKRRPLPLPPPLHHVHCDRLPLPSLPVFTTACTCKTCTACSFAIILI